MHIPLTKRAISTMTMARGTSDAAKEPTRGRLSFARTNPRRAIDLVHSKYEDQNLKLSPWSFGCVGSFAFAAFEAPD